MNTFAGPRGSDNYSTPKDFVQRLEAQLGLKFDDFDPCPINPEGLRTYDGNAEWPKTIDGKPLKTVFVNFPYSDPVPWLRRIVKESQEGRTVTALMRGDTSTSWYHELVLPFASEIIFVRGRIKFRFYQVQDVWDPSTGKVSKQPALVTDRPAPFASIVAVYKPPEIKLQQQVMITRSIRA